MHQPKICVVLPLLFFTAIPLAADDWPMWRYDAQRSASAPHALPDKLHLQWKRDFPTLQPAWPDQPKLQFDVNYEPIVKGKLLFLTSPQSDWIAAFDTASGKLRWRFFTDGPVRFAPAAWKDRLFVVSDDGYLYCLRCVDGKLLWKFRGGPSDRKILGNGRLISTWPARGAPVVADDTVYFAAGIWPFMGIFLYAIDAESGRVVWVNDADGSRYMRQPHHTDSFAGVSPQGPMAVIGDKLIVPGGRSVPAIYDRNTGKLIKYQLDANGKRGGGFDVAVTEKMLLNDAFAFDLKTQRYLGEVGKPFAFSGGKIYSFYQSRLRGFDLKSAGEKTITTTDRRGKKVKKTRWEMTRLASWRTGEIYDCIKAGDRLYAAGDGRILFCDAGDDKKALGEIKVEGKVLRLIAANGRLFTVTREGRLYCFAGAKGADVANADTEIRREIVGDTTNGYGAVWNVDDERFLTSLIEESKLHWIVFNTDHTKVHKLRNTFLRSKIYGTRVAVHYADPAKIDLAAYFANAIIAEKIVPSLLQSVRPYGGVYCLLKKSPIAGVRKQLRDTPLANADIRHDKEMTIIKRSGALHGAANWTHEHADAANTRVSKDQLVKAPLGVLWFGGSSHAGVLPRHGHGPQPQVIDGRLIIEGVDFIRAMDIYTGKVLWQTPLPGVGDFYNVLSHQPGANAGGSNFVSMSDGIYVAYRDLCVRLDPATGARIASFKLPQFPGMMQAPKWGYINAVGDYLIGGADPLYDPDAGKPVKTNNLLGKLLSKLSPPQNDNFSSSKHLVVMNRQTGKVLWKVSARAGFRHNATCIGGGLLYTIDRLSGEEVARLKRRGKNPNIKPRLLVLDLKTGQEIWSTEKDVFGTWLSFSAKRNILLEAGRVARDSLSDEARGIRAFNAKTGKVVWHERGYTGPAMIHGDTILTGYRACELLTGKQKMRRDPLSGLLVPWTWQRNYGCNTPSASQHLLTFRSGAAGFFDLCRDGGTGNFGGFRSSCTNNLMVAGGVLTAPDYTRTCTCNYQNQTSLALVPMPEAELWTFFGSRAISGPIKHVGINLGAIGDRRDDNGTLWIEYPSVAGNSPELSIETLPLKLKWFRRHSSNVTGKFSWVASSGVLGLRKIKIALSRKPMAQRKFTVRLFFAEPKHLQVGQRLIKISLQGHQELANLDIVKSAGGPQRTYMAELRGIKITHFLLLELAPSPSSKIGETLICGIELHEE